jgi:hypothetical protein
MLKSSTSTYKIKSLNLLQSIHPTSSQGIDLSVIIPKTNPRQHQPSSLPQNFMDLNTSNINNIYIKKYNCVTIYLKINKNLFGIQKLLLIVVGTNWRTL